MIRLSEFYGTHHPAYSTPPKEISQGRILVSNMYFTVNLKFEFAPLVFMILGLVGEWGVLLPWPGFSSFVDARLILSTYNRIARSFYTETRGAATSATSIRSP